MITFTGSIDVLVYHQKITSSGVIMEYKHTTCVKLNNTTIDEITSILDDIASDELNNQPQLSGVKTKTRLQLDGITGRLPLESYYRIDIERGKQQSY